MVERATRRGVLAALGGGAVALAGCAGDDGGVSGSPTATPTPTPEPPTSLDAEWSAPSYDAGLSNCTGAAGPTDRPAELWSVTPGGTLSTPVVADGRVFVSDDDGTVRAFDGVTGEQAWGQSVGATGPPWVVEGTVHVPTETGIVALSTGDGGEQWRVETPGRVDAVVAAHGLYWLAGGEEPAVVRVGLDGEERWRTTLGECPWRPHLFAGASSVFVSTDTNARVPWTLAVETGDLTATPYGCGYDFQDERFHRDGTVYAVGVVPSVLTASPVGDGDGWTESLPAGEHAVSGGRDRVYVAVSGGEQPGLYALDVADGSREWRVGSASPDRPVVASESVLVHVDGEVRCQDPTSGDELWSRPTGEVGDRLAVVDDLLFATGGGTVRALRAP